MFGTGILGGLIAKLAGLGTAAKAGVAATTAALTVTMTGGTAALVMKDSGDSVPVTAQAAGEGSTTASAAGASPASTVESTADVGAAAESSTAAPSTSARASAEVTTPTVPTSVAPAVTPTVPSSVPLVGGVLPDLSALAGLPDDVMACVTPILDLVGQLPNVSVEQITALGQSIVNCVTGIVENIPLPFGLNGCVSGIMGFVRNIVSSLPFGMPDLGSLNIGACIPSGLPIPSLPGIPFLGGGGGGGGFLGGLFG